jgi:glucose-1-phosphate cytidylyltransferase
MKIYAAGGQTTFSLALGWLGEVIKEFFLHYEAMTRDFTIELGNPNGISYLDDHPERGWKVSCVDTGLDTLTGTRVREVVRHLDAETVMVTYGDSVGDVDVAALLDFHRSHGRLATMTAVRPPGRFGELDIGPDQEILAFEEKPQTSTGAINGGFMVFERAAIERYVPADRDVMLEREPLNRLAADGELRAFEHAGFWQPMDTPREHELLTSLWESGKAPWKVWS